MPFSPLAPEAVEEIPGDGMESIPGMVVLLTKLALQTATEIAKEALRPQSQELGQCRENQWERALAQQQLELGEIQSPQRKFANILQRYDGEADTRQLSRVRSELSELVQHTPYDYKPVSMSPLDFVQQQAMGVKSAIGLPQTLDGVRAELSTIPDFTPTTVTSRDAGA